MPEMLDQQNIPCNFSQRHIHTTVETEYVNGPNSKSFCRGRAMLMMVSGWKMMISRNLLYEIQLKQHTDSGSSSQPSKSMQQNRKDCLGCIKESCILIDIMWLLGTEASQRASVFPTCLLLLLWMRIAFYTLHAHAIRGPKRSQHRAPAINIFEYKFKCNKHVCGVYGRCLCVHHIHRNRHFVFVCV